MNQTATIGVIADTHGLLRPELLEQFKGVDSIVHAGDIGSPEVLAALQEIAPVYGVRGNADKGDWADSLPLFDLFEIAGHFVYLIHDLKEIDLDPVAAGIQVVISGHSHRAEVMRKKGILYLNPGSAGPRRFKLPISAALLRLECGGNIEAELLTIQSKTIRSQSLPASEVGVSGRDGEIKKIVIYGDFGCGLWIEGVGTDLDDSDLPFSASPELCARFEAWVDDYTNLMVKDGIDEEAWILNEQEGRELAKEIKKLAGPDIEVIYGPCRESMNDYIAMPEEVME